jgi:hypothetical protein
MNMKKLNPFAKPSADVLAVVELEEARRQLLAAQSALEYAASMVDYNTNRVARLEQRVKEVAQ